MRPRWLILASIALLSFSPAHAGHIAFDLHLDVPPVLADTMAPTGCTVTYLVADTASNDLFAARMRVAAVETDSPVNNRMPCPPNMSPYVGKRALDVCTSRAADIKTCVFADMSRRFDSDPDIRNTAQMSSRCSSDKFSDIGVACRIAGKLSVCNVGCGNSGQEAMLQARTRCEAEQQQSCPITGSVPVAGP